MPELPEVETVRRGLQDLIVGKEFLSEVHDWPKGFPNTQPDVDKFLLGSRVKEVARRAKVLMIHLDSGYSLVVHLKMTGQLVFVGEHELKVHKVEKSKTEGKMLGAQHSNSDIQH